MGDWTGNKTVAFGLIYLFILAFTWKFTFVEFDLKYKLVSTIGGAIFIPLLLWMRE